MGRMSLSSEPGGCLFGTGTTVAVFQRSGSLPSLSELLKIAVTGGEYVIPKRHSNSSAHNNLLCSLAYYSQLV